MSGISPDLYNRLRAALLECDPFATDHELVAVFSDRRISPWRNRLPQARNPTGRVEAVVDYLARQFDESEQNGLVLLLHVLRDRLDEREHLYRTLNDLAGELAQEIPADTRRETPLTGFSPVSDELARVFLCYSRHAGPDQELAHFLHNFLTSQGHRVFIDKTIRAGADWLQRIDEEIRKSDSLIVLLSDVSADSEMVQAEVRRAYEYRRMHGRPQTLPVRVAFTGPLPYTLDFFLNPLQYIAWHGPEDNPRVAEEIVAALSGRLATKAPQAWQIHAVSEDGRVLGHVEEDISPPLPSFDPRFLDELGAPGGAVRLRSQFYVERDADVSLRRQIRRPGSITTIRASRQTGKSSLLVRGVHGYQQQGAQVINLDMQRVDRDTLQDPENFLSYLASFIAHKLRHDPDVVQRAWQGSLGPQDKLTYLMEDHILAQAEQPVVLAIDEADRLLETSFHTDFFGLIRSWHNSAAYDPLWERLSLIMVISTEPYLLITDVNQSPFNVGLKLYLDDFDGAQVQDLNKRHGSPVPPQHFLQFMTLLGGHPYLTRKALYTLVTREMDWSELMAVAPADNGPFGDHLRRQQWLLRDEPVLQAAMRQIVRHNRCDDEMARFRLLRAGLIKGRGDVYSCRCDLYRLYFQDKL